MLVLFFCFACGSREKYNQYTVLNFSVGVKNCFFLLTTPIERIETVYFLTINVCNENRNIKKEFNATLSLTLLKNQISY